MYQFVSENRDFILYLLLLAIGLLSYNMGHHIGFIKGFRTGRRAGVRHPSARAGR